MPSPAGVPCAPTATRTDPYRGARPTSRGRRSLVFVIWVTHAGRTVGTYRKKNWFRDTVPYKNDIIFCLLFYFFSFLRRYIWLRPNGRIVRLDAGLGVRTASSNAAVRWLFYYYGCSMLSSIVVCCRPVFRPVRVSFFVFNKKLKLLTTLLFLVAPPFFLRASLALGRSNGAATPSA